MTEKKKKLNAKQQAFVNEFVIDKNGFQAVIRAGYSETGAGVTANRLLKNPKIREEIDKRLAKSALKQEITLDRVIQRYGEFAFANVDLKDLKPADSLKALDSLMRHLGGFANDTVNLKASEGLVQLLQAATNRGHVLPKDAEKRERLHS